MKVHPINTSPTRTEADAVVVGVFAERTLSGPAKRVDEATGGMISSLIERNEITGEKYQVTPLLSPPGIAADQITVVGLGPQDALDAGTAFRAAAAAMKHLAAKERGVVTYYLGDDWAAELVESAVAGAIVGCHGQDIYRAKKKLHPPNEVLFAGGDEQAVLAGEILGDSVNFTRRLVNEPPDDIYPESLADAAATMAGECGLECEVWDKTRLEKERCGALLAVSRGSSRDPRLVMLRHQGGAVNGPLLALVGKGVTFDSGGLSLKSAEHMMDMKMDMAGAGTVLGAMRAIGKLKVPVNVVGLVGLTENMTGPAAYKVGDVLRTRNGTTIEVHNTDAEGRLVLADVLDVAVSQQAAKIIDLATLTGACMVALGLDVAGVMSNDQQWCDEVLAAAGACGELAWQLPMLPEYDELIESEVADIKNVGDGRWGGAITAAKLLERFVGDTPWAHIDIAGPAFRNKAKAWCDAGASGEFVRTLVQVARRWQ